MNLPSLPRQKSLFGIAVRDGSDLFLFLSICRSAQGDIYVNWPRHQEPSWQPHASYHASGQRHQKGHNHKFDVRQLQPPDKNFKGSENVTTTPIAIDEPRACNVPCQPNYFQDVFEIPVGDLRPEKYRTAISIDLSDAAGCPIITPGATILRQWINRDVVPWIVVTLFDTG